mmetsp:Transcript_18844/g.31518  ORF Transcript_18844/g.31518 Transcript_18844/m.31518 type:complete len:306 (+) Transcript_18844:71-988(+)
MHYFDQIVWLLLPVAQVATAPIFFEAPQSGKYGMCSNALGNHVLNEEESWLQSIAECEAACSISPGCTAYEFQTIMSDHRGYKRCKTFLDPIEKSLPVNPRTGAICMVKVSTVGQTVSSGRAPVVVPAKQTPPPVTSNCQSVTLTKQCSCCPYLKAGVDLTNLVPQCLDLKGGNFQGVNLAGAVLTGADISCANFANANLKGVVMTSAEATGATFRGTNGEGMVIDEANLFGADFSNAYLLGVKAQYANLENTKFDGANVGGADFRETNVVGSSFNGAKGVTNADFWKASGMETVQGILPGMVPP